jgi:hypothetical protein
MIVGNVPMTVQPGQGGPFGRACIGGQLSATCAIPILAPTIFAFLRTLALMTSAGATNPSSIPAGA